MIRMRSNSTLLCIHRDPDQLNLLKENGYELATATNGTDGLRLFKSRPVDAVVLEHHLSLLNGTAIADEIKRARPEIPIIVLVDHMELPAAALKSVDALVVKSDGAHFLWATVHFVLNVKPSHRRRPAKSLVGGGRGQATPSQSATAGKDTPFSREVWRSIYDGTLAF